MSKFYFVLVAASVILGSGLAQAGSDFTDSNGRFTIDLPKGWKLEPQAEETVYVFKGDDKTIVMEYLPAESDPEQLHERGLNTLKASGFASPKLHGAMQSFSINGNPARWAVHRQDTDVEVGDKTYTVTMHGLIGGVGVGEGGLYFMALIGDDPDDGWAEKFKKSFESIRAAGVEKTGSTEAVAVEQTAGEAVLFEHELATLEFPGGWTPRDLLPGFEKEALGWYFYDPIPGANVIMMGYKGFGMNESKVLKAAKQTAEASIPGAELSNAYEFEHDNGQKAKFFVYRGKAVASGTEMDMSIVTCTVKAKKCWVCLMAYVPTPSEAAIEDQIRMVSRSVR